MVSEGMVNGASAFISGWCQELLCATLRFRRAFCRGHCLSENPYATGIKKVATCWYVIPSQGEVSSVCWEHFYIGITEGAAATVLSIPASVECQNISG